MLQTFTADQRVKMEADRSRVSRGAAQVREIGSFKLKEGGLNLMVIFVAEFKPKPRAAAATVAVGQGPAAGGGGAPASDKKPPPASMRVMIVGVPEAAAAWDSGCEYKVKDKNTISMPALDWKVTKDAKEAWERAAKAIAEAKKNGGEVTPEMEEEMTKADHAVKAATTPVEWMDVTQGDFALVKCFARDRVSAISPFQVVNLMGFEASASYSTKYSKYFIDLKCEAPVTMSDSSDDPLTNITRYIDLCQVPLRQPGPQVKWGRTYAILFADYMATNGETGPVIQRVMCSSENTEDWMYGKDKEEKKLKAQLTMWQKQKDSVLGFPEGDYYVTCLMLDGDWRPENNSSRNTLRKAMGINNAQQFGKIMASNPIAWLVFAHVDVKAARKANQGYMGKGGSLPMWADAAFPLLRDYLLSQCPRVTFDYVKGKLLMSNAAHTFVQLNDPNRPCQLNAMNVTLDRSTSTRKLIGGKVVNVSEYSGDLAELDAQCEFRVMHSSLLNSDLRYQLGTLSAEEGTKVMNGAADAKVRLMGNDITSIIYAVAPITDEEKAKMQKSEAERVARDSQVIVVSPPIPAAVDGDADPAPAGDAMDIDDDDAEMLAAVEKAEAAMIAARAVEKAEADAVKKAELVCAAAARVKMLAAVEKAKAGFAAATAKAQPSGPELLFPDEDNPQPSELTQEQQELMDDAWPYEQVDNYKHHQRMDALEIEKERKEEEEKKKKERRQMVRERIQREWKEKRVEGLQIEVMDEEQEEEEEPSPAKRPIVDDPEDQEEEEKPSPSKRPKVAKGSASKKKGRNVVVKKKKKVVVMRGKK